MTHYPEAYLARELEMCYVNISLVTDYDVGLEGDLDLEARVHRRRDEGADQNNDRVRTAIGEIVATDPGRIRVRVPRSARAGASVT